MACAAPTNSTTVSTRTYGMNVKIGDVIGTFTLKSPVAEGNSGEVWKAVNQDGSEVVAIKFIKYSQNGAAKKRALRVSSLIRERARHGIRFLCVPEQTAIFKGYDCIISRLYSVDVHTLLQTERLVPLPTDHCKAISWQILSGLYYLHSIGIVHGDIKPENVLLASMATVKIRTLEEDGLFETKEILQSPEVKIADLDDARLPRQKDYQPLGTSGYRAPELLSGGDASERTDVFALGCMTYELHTSLQLFPNQKSQSSNGQVDGIAIISDPSSKWSHMDDEDATAFIKRAILENHKRRPLAKTLLKHRYFGDLAYVEKE